MILKTKKQNLSVFHSVILRMPGEKIKDGRLSCQKNPKGQYLNTSIDFIENILKQIFCHYLAISSDFYRKKKTENFTKYIRKWISTDFSENISKMNIFRKPLELISSEKRYGQHYSFGNLLYNKIFNETAKFIMIWRFS